MRFFSSRLPSVVSGRRTTAVARAVPRRPESVARSTGYSKFIILGAARTGSNMLVQALNSSPELTCFGELFHPNLDFLGFNVEGYDNFDNKDRALRDGDLPAFLRERVYCAHPEATQAVGFKLLYGHVWGFPGLLGALTEDTEIRVLHLKRRNLLRTMLSLKIAETTGVWLEDRRLTLANIGTALRHPLRVATRLRRPLRRPPASRVKLTLPVEECRAFFYQRQRRQRISMIYFASTRSSRCSTRILWMIGRILWLRHKSSSASTRGRSASPSASKTRSPCQSCWRTTTSSIEPSVSLPTPGCSADGIGQRAAQCCSFCSPLTCW